MVGPRRVGLMLLALLVPTVSAGKLPCVASARVVPEEAFVGQQVLYVLHIEQRHDVARVHLQPPLSFPSLRSEWLPTVRLPDPDEGTRAYEERRALHPGHAGELLLPEAGLLCETPAGGHLVRVPPVQLRVRPVPEATRPANWSGTVGPLELHWSLTPDRVALGESARLSVRIEGPGTVWRVDPDVERMLAPGDADIFALEPDEQRDKGRTLSIRSYRRYDVVPRRAGELLFTGLRLSSFDPVSQRFEEHALPDLVLQVAEAKTPRSSGGQGDPPEALRRTASPGEASPLGGSTFPIAGLILALGLASGAFLLRRRAVKPAVPARAAERLLAEAEALLDEGDPAAAATALAHCVSALAKDSSEIGDPFAAEAPDPRARGLALLEKRLERARFAADTGPTGPADDGDDRELRSIASALGALLMTD